MEKGKEREGERDKIDGKRKKEKEGKKERERR